MYVIGVGDVALVRNAGDYAETLLQALCELVRRGFEGRTVKRIVDILLLLPLRAGVVEALHDLKTQLLALRFGELSADQLVHALPQSRIAEGYGGVAAVKELVYLLALFEPCERAVLPKYGCGVGKRSFETLVTRLQCAVAKFQPLVEYAVELLHVVGTRTARHVHEVYGDDALIETSVILGLAVFVHVRSEEGAAAHAGVALTVAVLVHLVFEHDLFADVIGDHAPCRAFRGKFGEVVVRAVLVNVALFENVYQFGESRSDVYAHFVLDALVTLAQHLLYDEREVLSLRAPARLAEVHEYGHERRLSVGREQGDELILYRLYALLDLLFKTLFDYLRLYFRTGIRARKLEFRVHVAGDLLARDLNEGSEVRQAYGLSAVLVGRHLRYDLRRYVARRRKAVRTLYHSAANDGAVLKHVFEIDQIAVVHMLREVVRVVEVDESLFVRLYDVGCKEKPLGKVLADLARHVVALHGVDRRVLVAVLLLDLLVIALYEREYGLIRRVRTAREIALMTVPDVPLSHFISAQLHYARLDEILHFLDVDRPVHFKAVLFDGQRKSIDPVVRKLGLARPVRLLYRVSDLLSVELDFRAVSLDDLHDPSLPCFLLENNIL